MSRLLEIEVDNSNSFRWVECQFKSLQFCPESEYHLDCLLNSLPESLDETYERMLCNIDKSLVEDCRRILTLLCFSARPLTVPELIDAIAVDISSARLNPKRRLRNADGIHDICVGLVDIIRADDPITSGGKEEQMQTFRIAHFSVQEYLESERIRSQKAATFSLTAVTAHAEIAQICLIYILEPGLAVTNLDEYPLARFATRFWFRHYESTEYQDSKSDHLILQFFQCRRRLFVPLIKLLGPVHKKKSNYYMLKSKDNPSPVYFASLLGLRWVLQELISAKQRKGSGRPIFPLTYTFKSVDVNAQGGYYGNALQAASYGGHEEVVKLLVHQGADVDAQGGKYGNALQAASFRGHEEVVKLLVHEGADVNAQGGFYGNALQAASQGGREKIVKLLVHEGADVNAPGGYFGNALQAASYGCREKILKLLVQEGTDFNAQSGYYGNALQAASFKGHEEVVKLLVGEGVDVNAQGGRYGNALQAASYGGHEEIAKLLVHEGADINAQGGDYGNALQAASSNGHEEVVKLLVHESANVNAQGGFYGNALQAASYGGDEEVVKLLVHEGADVNTQGGYYSNALQAASFSGNEEIVKLLVHEGADINAQGGRFSNALEAASDRGHETVIQLLAKHGAKSVGL